MDGNDDDWNILRSIEGVEKIMRGYLEWSKYDIESLDNYKDIQNIYSKLIIAQVYKKFLEESGALRAYLYSELLQELKNILETSEDIKHNKHIQSYIYGKDIEIIYQDIIEIFEYLYDIKKDVKKKQVNKIQERFYKYTFGELSKFVI